jgi:hypothetical protein
LNEYFSFFLFTRQNKERWNGAKVACLIKIKFILLNEIFFRIGTKCEREKFVATVESVRDKKHLRDQMVRHRIFGSRRKNMIKKITKAFLHWIDHFFSVQRVIEPTKSATFLGDVFLFLGFNSIYFAEAAKEKMLKWLDVGKS